MTGLFTVSEWQSLLTQELGMRQVCLMTLIMLQ